MYDPNAEAPDLHLDIAVSERPTMTVCTVHGTVARGNVTRLVDGLRAAFQISPQGAVLIDVTDADQLSPAAVRSLIAAARYARRNRRRLLICGLRDNAAEASQLRRLHALLTVLPDAASARAALTIDAGREPAVR